MFLQYTNKKNIEEIEKIILKKKSKYMPIKSKEEKGLYIFGDNFDSMSALLREFENKIDLVYIDPPFNTNQTFHYNEDKVSTISASNNDDIAYSDKMTFNEYLEFMRERLILIRKLLSPKGTLYLHIDSKVGHYLKILLDEIFGRENFVNDISRIKSNPKNFKRRAYGNQKDVIFVYSKEPKKNIFNNITVPLSEEELNKNFKKIDENGERYTTVPCHAPGETKQGDTGRAWRGLYPPKGRHWRVSPTELDKLDAEGLIEWSKNGNPRIKKYAKNHKGAKIQDIWSQYKDPQNPIYPTEKNMKMLEMIIEQSSESDSIIMDCFCGSGSFLEAGIKLDRYVIGMDQSEIARDIVKKKRSFENLRFVEIQTHLN